MKTTFAATENGGMKMRLIDADELRKQAYPFPCAIGVEYAVTLRAISDAPTIDPESLRPVGHWVDAVEQPYFRKHSHTKVCSECGRRKEGRWDFCPHCGARMEVQDDD